jgi:hypothetical protein
LHESDLSGRKTGGDVKQQSGMNEKKVQWDIHRDLIYNLNMSGSLLNHEVTRVQSSAIPCLAQSSIQLAPQAPARTAKANK